MTSTEGFIFMAMVFIAVVLLASSAIVPTAGTAAQASRKMRKRIGRHLDLQDPGTTSLLREQSLKHLSPFERTLENLPLISGFSYVVEQSGLKTSGYRVIGKAIIYGFLAGLITAFIMGSVPIGAVAGLIVFSLPILNVFRIRKQRMDLFEEQLPEALNIMSRALKAGHPFNETLNFVAEEMDDPIAKEFGRIFSDLNYGLPLKTAFNGILTRVPSLSLHTLVTAVMIQHESGGKLAEILENVSAVIRSRFRLQRKLKSLSAEGRMSAWVLCMIPFVLAGMMTITAPDYLPVLFNDPRGLQIVGFAFVLMCSGILWIRSIIRIQV